MSSWKPTSRCSIIDDRRVIVAGINIRNNLIQHLKKVCKIKVLLFPASLWYNWKLKSIYLRRTIGWFDICIHCELISTMLTDYNQAKWHIQPLTLATFFERGESTETCSLGAIQGHSLVLLTTVKTLYVRSLALCLIAGSRYSLTKISLVSQLAQTRIRARHDASFFF